MQNYHYHCFELFIDRPTNLTAHNLTRSNYKSHNTGKYLIGITPQETICFISKGWHGRASDQDITENSKFLKYVVNNKCYNGRWGLQYCQNTWYFGGKVKNTRFYKRPRSNEGRGCSGQCVIANVRIHVEQVISNVRKKYSILNGTYHLLLEYHLLLKGDGTEKLTTLDKIVHTVCTLINLCPSVVPLE